MRIGTIAAYHFEFANRHALSPYNASQTVALPPSWTVALPSEHRSTCLILFRKYTLCVVVLQRQPDGRPTAGVDGRPTVVAITCVEAAFHVLRQFWLSQCVACVEAAFLVIRLP